MLKTLFLLPAFRYNSLTVLREHELSGLENLELLMLHSNTIESIEDRAFQGLKSLQVSPELITDINIVLKNLSNFSILFTGPQDVLQ